ncbi:MAG: acyltransferase [Fibrobacteraceae bacterium]|nr:acyltransferase [Fibrobacteraceae bacterium]
METKAYKQNEIVWLSVLQGFAMLLVVLGHVFHGEAHYNWELTLQQVIYSFHMPLFMCVSGYLFYFTAIKKNKNYLDVVKNKAVRLLIPYFVLSVVTIVLKVSFSEYMRRGAEFSVNQLLDAFVWLTNMPLGEMWFINALFLLFLLYPLYGIADKKKIYEALLLIAFIAFYFIQQNNPLPSFVFNYGSAIYYGFYFYVGILLCKYGAKLLEKKLLIIPFVVAFAVLKILDIKDLPYLLPLCGTMASFYFAKMLAHVNPNMFKTFRNYTYQIFLIGIFPQIAVRVVIEKFAAHLCPPHCRLQCNTL